MRGGRLRRRVPRGRRAHRQARLHPGGRGGADPRRRLAAAQRWRARSSRCSAAASSSTAAATPRWTPPAPRKRLGADEAVVVYRRTRDRMPAHDFEVEEAARGGRADEVALDDQAGRRRQARRSSGWSSTRPASRSRPASSRSSRPTRSSSRSARRPTSSLLDGVPGIEVDDGVVQVGPNLMTGHPGIFAGGDMVPAERTVTVGRRPRQEGRPPHRRAGCAAAPTSRHPSTSSPSFERAQHLVLRGRAADRAAGARARAPAAPPSTRSSAASTRRPRSSRRAAASRAATASPATTASASAPTTP